MEQVSGVLDVVMRWLVAARGRTGVCGAVTWTTVGPPWICPVNEGEKHDEHVCGRGADEVARWSNIAIDDRERATSRLVYLAAGLTDEALAAVLAVAEAAPKRPLDRGAPGDLDGRILQALLDVGAPDRTNNEGAERSRREEAQQRLEVARVRREAEAAQGRSLSTPWGDGAVAAVHGLLAEEHDRETAARRAQVTALEHRVAHAEADTAAADRDRKELLAERDALRAKLAAFTAPVDVEAEVRRLAAEADGLKLAGSELQRLGAWRFWLRPHVEHEAQLARRVLTFEAEVADYERTVASANDEIRALRKANEGLSGGVVGPSAIDQAKLAEIKSEHARVQSRGDKWRDAWTLTAESAHQNRGWLLDAISKTQETERKALPLRVVTGGPPADPPTDRGEGLRLVWLEVNKLDVAGVHTVLQAAQRLAKDPEIATARASSPETGPFVEQDDTTRPVNRCYDSECKGTLSIDVDPNGGGRRERCSACRKSWMLDEPDGTGEASWSWAASPVPGEVAEVETAGQLVGSVQITPAMDPFQAASKESYLRAARRRSRSWSASLGVLAADGCTVVEGDAQTCLVRWPDGETFPRPVSQ